MQYVKEIHFEDKYNKEIEYYERFTKNFKTFLEQVAYLNNTYDLVFIIMIKQYYMERIKSMTLLSIYYHQLVVIHTFTQVVI